MIQDLLKYGNEWQIQGVVFGNGMDNSIVLFPEASNTFQDELGVIQPNHEEWKELLYQLDTLGVEVLGPNGKIILRKSQRQIEQNIAWNVFRRDQYQCRYCGNDKVALTVDHVVLWEDMGDTVEDNLISACKKCNSTRGNMPYLDWIVSPYYKKVKSLSLGHSVHDFIYDKSHKMNEEAWVTAQRVPLRQNKRSR